MGILLMALTPSFKSIALTHLSLNSHIPNEPSKALLNTSFIDGTGKKTRHLVVSTKHCQVPGNGNGILFAGCRKFSARAFANPEAHISSLEEEYHRDGVENNDYPMVRIFENDLCRLTLIGERSLDEAIAAAAADGGLAAAEHIASGRPLMIIETIYPGDCSDNSTVATRLIVPASKVLEKAKGFWPRGSDAQSNSLSKNVLAMSFRKVVMRCMWNFELSFFNPGTCRDMGDLATPREVQVFGCLTSSDERVLTGLAEAVCCYAAACMKDDFHQKMLGRSSNNLLQNFQNEKWMVSSDSHVRIRSLSEAEIAAHLKSFLERSGVNKERENYKGMRTSHNWWPRPSCSSSILNTYSVESDFWISEYVPLHKLQVDFGRFENMKIQGWQKCSNHVCEILLSHRQLVELADVFDMYYEDPNTCPEKQLQSRIILEAPKLFTSKITLSLWRALYASLAGGIVLLSVIIVARLWKPNLLKVGIFSSNSETMTSPVEKIDKHYAHQSKKQMLPQNEEVSAEEMQVICTLVVEMVKNALQWPDDIKSTEGKGAWIGKDLTEWGRLEDKFCTTAVVEDDPSSGNKKVETINETGVKEHRQAVASKGDTFSQDHIQGNLQGPNTSDIAVYEVTLSRDGNLLGFQPTSRAAVNRWASNPLAKALYGNQKIRPGLFEPRLKFKGPPKDAVVVELLMLDDPTSRLITARPCHT